jgi:hypothetical protein
MDLVFERTWKVEEEGMGVIIKVDGVIRVVVYFLNGPSCAERRFVS